MNEIEATAKVTEEVAKTSGKALEVMQQLGTFTARVMGEPIEQTVGLLTDKLRFMRWQRQLRLFDRWKEIIEEREIDLHSARLSPKLGLPIIENATLEEDDHLQDIWARLLASCMDPKNGRPMRSAFIEIVKQLETIDATTLRGLHAIYLHSIDSSTTKMEAGLSIDHSPSSIKISRRELSEKCGLGFTEYEQIMDNLFRLRLCAPFILNDEFDVVKNGGPDKHHFSTVFQYDPICITSLGLAFVEACIE